MRQTGAISMLRCRTSSPSRTTEAVSHDTPPSTMSRPPHHSRSISGWRCPGSATEPTASAVCPAKISGEATEASRLRAHVGGSPCEVRWTQVEWAEDTAVREGGSGRARALGSTLDSPALTESSTAWAPEACSSTLVVSSVSSASSSTLLRATVGRSRRVIASSSAEAVRAALDSRATRWRSMLRTTSRLSPRTAETGST